MIMDSLISVSSSLGSSLLGHSTPPNPEEQGVTAPAANGTDEYQAALAHLRIVRVSQARFTTTSEFEFELSVLLREMVATDKAHCSHIRFHGIAKTEPAVTICRSPLDVDNLMIIARQGACSEEEIVVFEEEKARILGYKTYLKNNISFSETMLDTMSLLSVLFTYYSADVTTSMDLRDKMFEAGRDIFLRAYGKMTRAQRTHCDNWPFTPADEDMMKFFSLEAKFNKFKTVEFMQGRPFVDSEEVRDAMNLCIHQDLPRYLRALFPMGMHLVTDTPQITVNEELALLLDFLPPAFDRSGNKR